MEHTRIPELRASSLEALFSVVIPVLNEADSVVALLRSLNDQKARPIEAIVVDGGSKDGTQTMVTMLAEELSSDDFKILLINEKEFQQEGSVAFARNLGMKFSRGENVLLLDADFVLLDVNTLSQLADSLRTNAIARFEASTIPGNWLECQIELDSKAPLFGNNSVGGWAFKSWVLERFSFDESLGFGEDMDFTWRILSFGLRPDVIAAVGLRHFPHTLKNLAKQKLWYGRTSLTWLRKHHSSRELLVLSPLITFVLFVAQFIGYAFSILFGTGLSVAFLTIPLLLLGKSRGKNLRRISYLIFVRSILGTFFFTLGFVQSVSQLLLRGRIKMSRD